MALKSGNGAGMASASLANSGSDNTSQGSKKKEKFSVKNVLRRIHPEHATQGSEEHASKVQNLQTKEHTFKTTSDPSRQSHTIARRSTATSNLDLPEKDPLAKLRQEGRDLERKLPVQNSDSLKPPPVPAAPEFRSREGTMSTMSTLSRQSTIEQTVSGPLSEPYSLVPISNSSRKYSIKADSSSHTVYAAEPQGHNFGNQHYDTALQAHASVNGVGIEYNSRSPDYTSAGVDVTALEFRSTQLQLELKLAQQKAERDAEIIRSLQSLKVDHEQLLQTRESIISGLRSELSTSKTALNSVAANAAKLDNTNANLQQDIAITRAEFDKVNDELRNLKLELKIRIEDKWFVARWKDLHTKIENLSHLYFVGRPSRLGNGVMSRTKEMKSKKEEGQKIDRLARLTQSQSQYLGSESGRPLLIQAYIWWILTNKIFDHMNCYDQGLYWAGRSREQVWGLKNALRPIRRKNWPQSDPTEFKRFEAEARNFHKWRATTSIMLLAREPVAHRITGIAHLTADIVSEMLEVLYPIVGVPKDDRSAAEADIRKQLQNIITSAIKLDAEMHQQSPWIFCEQWSAPHLQGDPLWGFQWNPSNQEMVNGPGQAKGGRKQFVDPCVELIVQPALCREGDEYGQNYSVREVLCMAKVVVSENPTLPASQRWYEV